MRTATKVALFALLGACGPIDSSDGSMTGTSGATAGTDSTADASSTTGASTTSGATASSEGTTTMTDTSTDTSTTTDTSTSTTSSTTSDESTTTAGTTGDTTGDDTGMADPGCGAPGGLWTNSSGGGRAVWGSASDDVWVVGPGESEARHWDGQSWALVDLNAPGFVPHALTGSGSADVYVAASDGQVLRWSGDAWLVDGAVAPAPALWAVGPGEVVAVGEGDSAWIRANGLWSATPLVTAWPLRAIAGDGPGDLFAVGDHGVAMHFDGDAWSPLETGTIVDLRSVWPLGPGAAAAVGDAGVVLRLTSDGTTPLPPLPAPWTEHPQAAVWAAGEGSIFVVETQTMHHFDGQSWTSQGLPFFDAVAAIWGAGPGDLWVVGAQIATLHCQSGR